MKKAAVKKTRNTKDHRVATRVIIISSMNNTLVSVTTDKGDVLFQKSSGAFYKGAKKSTPGAAEQVGRAVAEFLKKNSVSLVGVYLRGVGPGRDAVVKALDAANIPISALGEQTRNPHNGNKRRKPRRI